MRRQFSPVTSFSHFADTFFLINHISAVIFSLEEASCYSSLNRFRSIPLKDSRFLEAWYVSLPQRGKDPISLIFEMDTCSQSELEKDIEDVKLLQEALRYQEDDPSQQQQALRALADILSQNSESFPFDKCSSFCST